MSQPALRIFSYLPNPRVWKAQIAADLCGVNIEVIGDKPAQLGTWLWDYDARPLPEAERTNTNPNARTGKRGFSGTLFKTDEFLRAHPFGTVPAAFSTVDSPAVSPTVSKDADGLQSPVGIFESNSILRAVARAGASGPALYGANDQQASRIDSFLDANLVFAREAQVYLLALESIEAITHARMLAAYEFYLAGIEQALGGSSHIAGATLSIADISFVCDFAQFLREGHYAEQLESAGMKLISQGGPDRWPRAYAHMLNLSETPEFAAHMGTYLDWYRRKIA